MKNVAEIEPILLEIASLLRLGAIDDWADAFDGFAMRLRAEPDRVTSDVLATYGGMGSFNDIVLYRDGQPLAQENQRLDTLREQLYRLCRA